MQRRTCSTTPTSLRTNTCLTTLTHTPVNTQNTNTTTLAHITACRHIEHDASLPISVPLRRILTRQSSLDKQQPCTINILSVNVCGIKSKLHLKEFNELIMMYDIICMCEIKCDDVDMGYVREKMDVMGFDIVYKNRYEMCRYKSGGLAVAVKKKVSFKWKEVKNAYDTLLSIMIEGRSVNQDKDVIVTAVYIPPSHSRYGKPEHFDEMDELLLNYTNNDYHNLLCGDFNAHTGTMRDFVEVNEDHSDELVDVAGDIYTDLSSLGFSVTRWNKDVTRDRNSYGKKLIENCKNNDVFIFNGRLGDDCGVGSVTTTHNTTVDYVIGSPLLMKHVTQFKVLNYDALYSDVHCGLHTRLTFNVLTRPTTAPLERVNTVSCDTPGKWRVEKQGDYVRSIDVNRVNQLFVRVDELSVNDITTELKHILVDPAKEVFPKFKSKKYVKKNNNTCMKGYYNKSWKCRKEYHKAKHKYNLNKTNNNYNSMIEKSKKYKKEIKRISDKEKMNTVKKLREVKTKDAKAYWKILKANKKNTEIPIQLSDFYDHFKLLANDDSHHDGENIMYDVTSDVIPILNNPITENEIRKSITKLKNNKSPGNDMVINEYIKNTQDMLCPLYVKLFNKIFDSGVFPDEWLIGTIVPLYKNKGDSHDPNNYRGITLLSCTGKLFTSVLNDRLTHYSDSINIISETQAGFRQDYSTLDHIFLLKCIIDIFKWKKKKLFCLFVDYTKAFDLVWREGLWLKLVKENVNGKMFNIIRNMYSNIKSCVLMNQVVSDSFVCNIGVRQG